MDEHEFDEFEGGGLTRTAAWVGLGLIAAIGVLMMVLACSCATTGPNYVPPLPPVPDISGPPLMARADAGARG